MSILFIINRMEIKKLSPEEHKYLQIVSTIAVPPEKLYYRGKLPPERRPTVAIVGTRKPTAYGREVAHKLAFDLAKRGVVIVSGLALGIDGIAHRAALEAGGTTLAVLGNSVDEIYPRTHTSLGEQIVREGGAIISEYEPPMGAHRHNFLARNRLVSALSDAVVIVEAAARSGTLNTAMHALEQGKELFAVPGNITSPMSTGCNYLIRQGAAPVIDISDIIDIIAPQLTEKQSVLPLGTTVEETAIIELLRGGMRDGDELQRASGIEAGAFSATLTTLELTGIIRPLGANQWTLR